MSINGGKVMMDYESLVFLMKKTESILLVGVRNILIRVEAIGPVVGSMKADYLG